MCQQWFLIIGHLLELVGFLLIVFELREQFRQKKYTGGTVFTIGVVFVVIGMLGQTAGSWIGRIPLNWIMSCY
jgi:hypothetical protein